MAVPLRFLFSTLMILYMLTGYGQQNLPWEKIPVQTLHSRTTFPEANDKAPALAGYFIDVPSTDLSDGILLSMGRNRSLWATAFEVQGAEALNVVLTELRLSAEDTLFLYGNTDDDPPLVLTRQRNMALLSTDYLQGSRLTLVWSTDASGTSLPFGIGEVGVLLHEESRGFGDAGSCEVHINCPEGSSWQDQKQGVARILVKEGNLSFWCTGSLVNNTRQDGRMLFLTANHCGVNSSTSDYAQWHFFFDYESPNCAEPLFEPDYTLITGSDLLAHSGGTFYNSSDFKLLQLHESLPEGQIAYFNGWDRSGQAATQGVTIHHPQGDVKMISTYEQPLISSPYSQEVEDPEGMFWRVYWNATVSGHGVTEGGSSGSPLFDQNGLVVGSLTGGSASCDFLTYPDYYGKFSVSWARDADSSASLAHWLDPDNTGLVSLNGTNLDTNNVFAWFYADKTQVLMGEKVQFNDLSTGPVSGWQWTFEGGTPSGSNEALPPPITYDQAGTYSVTLTVTSAGGENTLTRTDYINVLPNVAPNPSTGVYRLAFKEVLPEDAVIEVMDATGRPVNFRVTTEDSTIVVIDLQPNPAGLYLLRLQQNGQVSTYHLIMID